MVSSKAQVMLWKILILLELINYQVVTMMFNDFILLKFMRDILLIVIVCVTISKDNFKIKINKVLVITIVFCICILAATIKTKDLRVSIVFLRKYLSPLIFLWALTNSKIINKDVYYNVVRYLLSLLSILSIWGILQAYLLRPEFLIKMGYPTKYSHAYNAITLKESFYFGNLGIQRVVSTVSNSNVFALILGVFLISVLFDFKSIIKTKLDVAKVVTIAFGYLLTFSRANILAFLIVTIIILWKYIPRKKYIFIGMAGCLLIFGLIYLFQDENGITHKLTKWVIDSLTFKESSAAGRTRIWKEGFDAVINKISGYGFGKVGAYAQINGVKGFLHCENSYLAISIDLGVLGLFSYISYIIVMFMTTIKCRKKLMGAAILYMAITFMFSNHIYDREAMMVICLLLGMNMNMKEEGENSELLSDSVHV